MLVAAAVSPNESRNTKFIVVCSGTGARPSPWSPAAAPRTARAARTTPSPLFPAVGRGAAVLRATALPRRCRNGGAGCVRASRLTLYRACSAEAGRGAPMGAREVAYSTGLYDQCIDLERKWAKRAHPRPRGREAARSRGRGPVLGSRQGARILVGAGTRREPRGHSLEGPPFGRPPAGARTAAVPEHARARSRRSRGIIEEERKERLPQPDAARRAGSAGQRKPKGAHPPASAWYVLPRPQRAPEPLRRCAAAPLRRCAAEAPHRRAGACLHIRTRAHPRPGLALTTRLAGAALQALP